MKRTLLASTLLLAATLSFAQTEKYSRVRIHTDNPAQLESLVASGLEADHFTKSAPNSVDAVVSGDDIDLLESLKVVYDVLIDDVQVEYRASLQGLRSTGAPACNLQHFSYGTMGPYHTYDEVTAMLDSMKAAYPSLITAKFPIGTSVEGRSLWAVKISDNPDSNEAATEANVYFDALHHAREPLAMEPLLYYMWWLLEKYGSDAEATHLVDRRQMFFVPVVNPDGYVYNQTTDPNGGGMWRKNRRNNGGGAWGVDLNRNYSSGWGNPIGSSGNPASDTYRGDSAFSEPETRAVRDFVLSIDPKLVVSCHSDGQKWLVAPACNFPLERYEGYAEYTSEFINNSFDGYGTTEMMLGYSSCGATRHYFHDQGILSWTPEIGPSFWASQAAFCPTVQNMLEPLKYISFAAGSYTRMSDFAAAPFFALPGDTMKVGIRIKNRGTGFAADSVTVTVQALSGNATAVDSTAFHTTLAPGALATDTFRFAISPTVLLLDSVVLQVTIREGPMVTYQRIRTVWVGPANLVFADDAEGGKTNWNTTSWDTTFMDMQSGQHSFADTRYGNYGSNDIRTLALVPPIKLGGALHPVLEFMAKWSLESFDVVDLQISTNGTSWTTLASYSQQQHWIPVRIDLSAYVGQTVNLRFRLDSDGSVQCDGLYFDDFRVVDYVPSAVSAGTPPGAPAMAFFPNPVTDRLTIVRGRSEPARLSVFGCDGRQAAEFMLNERTETVSLESLPAGVYFVRIVSAGGSRLSRIVKN